MDEEIIIYHEVKTYPELKNLLAKLRLRSDDLEEVEEGRGRRARIWRNGRLECHIFRQVEK